MFSICWKGVNSLRRLETRHTRALAGHDSCPSVGKVLIRFGGLKLIIPTNIATINNGLERC